MENVIKRFGLAIAVSLLLSAGTARAEQVIWAGWANHYTPGDLQAGNLWGGSNSGGEFLFKVNGANPLLLDTSLAPVTSSSTNAYIRTFCLEETEYIWSYGQVFNATLSGSATTAGVAVYGGNVPEGVVTDPTTSLQGDAISTKTAGLFADYVNGNLFGSTSAHGVTSYRTTLNLYAYSWNQIADAVQLAIWAFEGEVSRTSLNGTLAGSLYDVVDSATFSGYGDVRVLNLWRTDYPGHLYDSTTRAQSQLVLVTAGGTGQVPLPGIALLGLASFGGLAGLRLRRRCRA